MKLSEMTESLPKYSIYYLFILLYGLYTR